jgi:hypothetical protein
MEVFASRDLRHFPPQIVMEFNTLCHLESRWNKHNDDTHQLGLVIE